MTTEPVIREVTVEGSFATPEEAFAALQRQALKDREAEQGARLRGKHAVANDEEVEHDAT
jgi:hypothetical protein